MSKLENSNNTKFSFKRLADGIMAIVMTLIVCSMAWSAYTIWNGLDGKLPKILIAPQIVFTVYLIVTAFVAKGKK
jgi:uncharacterized membrane protein